MKRIHLIGPSPRRDGKTYCGRILTRVAATTTEPGEATCVKCLNYYGPIVESYTAAPAPVDPTPEPITPPLSDAYLTVEAMHREACLRVQILAELLEILTVR